MSDFQGLMSDDSDKKTVISDALRRKSQRLADKVDENDDQEEKP